MSVDIQRMRSRIEVRSSQATEAGSNSDQGVEELKEALRPLVMEVIREEMEQYLRSRG